MTAAAVLAEVAATMRVLPEELTGRSRERHIARARHVAALTLRDLDYTVQAIGRHLGGRHHSTVIHSIRVAEAHPDLIITAHALAEKARAA